MKKLPNSLKYLQENDEIQEKVAKDISQKYICTMVELKNETKIKQLALTTTMKISLVSNRKRTSYSGDSVVSPANESHAGNNITSYQPMTNATLIVFRFRSLELPYRTKRIYLTEYHKRKRCYQG